MIKIMLTTILIICVLTSSALAETYYLCTEPNELHDVFEIQGMGLGNMTVQAENTKNQLRYDLSDLWPGAYSVRIRAYSYELKQWSAWSKEFSFLKMIGGCCFDITEGVAAPAGIAIEKDL